MNTGTAVANCLGRVLALVAGATALSVGLGWASPASAQEACTWNQDTVGQAASGLFAASNGERSASDQLAPHNAIAQVAQEHAERMASSERLYHNESYMSDRQRRESWGAGILGENVAVGCSVQAIHQAFMGSEHHRANILDGRFTHLGMGAAASDGGALYVVEAFAQIGAVPAPAPATPKSVTPVSAAPPKPAVAKPIVPTPKPAQATARIVTAYAGSSVSAASPTHTSATPLAAWLVLALLVLVSLGVAFAPLRGRAAARRKWSRLAQVLRQPSKACPIDTLGWPRGLEPPTS